MERTIPFTLRERLGIEKWQSEQPKVDRDRPTRVVTVRMPRGLHERLKAARLGDFELSINLLCVVAIEAALDELGAPVAAGKTTQQPQSSGDKEPADA